MTFPIRRWCRACDVYWVGPAEAPCWCCDRTVDYLGDPT